MNFITFPVGSTNIFPISNSTAGGQLLTEYNLRSRESIATAENVQYMIGPSYVHSENDFLVQTLDDGTGTAISSSVLEIRPGRGIFNGHFVELLTPMIIDMSDANIEARTQGLPALTGRLCVGVKVMYSTYDTMSSEFANSSIGAMLPESENMMYEGIQLVILPPSEFKLPEDVPTQQSSITAHIKLAEFTYINGRIQNIVNNYPAKCHVMPASRLGGVDKLLSDIYLTKSGLNPKKLYTFSGKGSVIKDDTWCDSTDSLMIWDKDPKLTRDKPEIPEAVFGYNANGQVQLHIPHKQVDGMTDSSGNFQYYASKVLDLPRADYHLGTPGTVDKNYTKQIKQVAERISEIYRMPNGKQIYYLDTLGYKLDDSGEKDLPAINQSWKAGDYIVVGQDNTVDSTTGGRAPSTMYVVVPGKVRRISQEATTAEVSKQSNIVNKLQSQYDEAQSSYNEAYNSYTEISNVVDQVEGVIKYITVHDPLPADDRSYVEDVLAKARKLVTELSSDDTKTTANNADDVLAAAKDTKDLISAANTLHTTVVAIQSSRLDEVNAAKDIMDTIAATLRGARLQLAEANGKLLVTLPPTGVELDFKDVTEDPSLLTIDEINERYWVLGDSSEYRGTVGVDYFTLNYTNESNQVVSYYYKVSESGDKEYSNAIYLTREIPLAQESVIGGFLNVPDDYTDAGYVQIDETGHLRLMDYSLLRSGALAYQLGEDFETPSGLATDEIQSYLDEYVNQRVAFSAQSQNSTASNSSVINVSIYLTKETETKTISIHDIDSRFNTCVYIHINGEADENTTINISNCEKLRIDSNIEGSPKINLYNSKLYYNSSVLNTLSIIEGLQLWYEKFDEGDPNLVVDNMTVIETDAPMVSEDLDYWSTLTRNDNHFMLGLKGITFDNSGKIIGCTLCVKNDTTYNIELGKSIITSEFELPQGLGLIYPVSRLTNQLKITGSFVAAYHSENSYIVANTSFTALSQVYDPYGKSNSVKGTIAFYVDTNAITNVYPSNTVSIDGWEPGSFHMFSGGAIS